MSVSEVYATELKIGDKVAAFGEVTQVDNHPRKVYVKYGIEPNDIVEVSV